MFGKDYVGLFRELPFIFDLEKKKKNTLKNVGGRLARNEN